MIDTVDAIEWGARVFAITALFAIIYLLYLALR